MYNILKRKSFTKEKTAVREVVEYLQTLNQDAMFCCDGDNYFFIHVDEDPINPIVNLDSSDLDSEYVESDEVSAEDYFNAESES